MTKSDFLTRIPGFIEHKTSGFGELKIIADKPRLKYICYRHSDKTTSCGKSAASWSELFNELSTHLISEGYMN